MNYDSLIEALGSCAAGGHYIDPTTLQAKPEGLLTQHLAGIQAVAQHIFKHAATPPNAERVEALLSRLERYDERSRHSAIVGLFSSIIAQEEKAFDACYEAVFSHVSYAYRLSDEELLAAFPHLNKNHLLWSAFYSAAGRSIPEVVALGDIESIRQLVPKYDAKTCPKHLDLVGYSERTLVDILRVHRSFSDLRVSLLSSQKELLRLIEKGHLKNVTSLNLAMCYGLDWKVIAQSITGLTALGKIKFPRDLINAHAPLDVAVKPFIAEALAYSHSKSSFLEPRNDFYTVYQVSWMLILDQLMVRIKGRETIGLGGISHVKTEMLPVWLRHVYLDFCPGITAEGLQKLFGLKLSSLSLRGCLQITDDYFQPLLGCGEVIACTVDLRGTRVSSGMITVLKAAHPQAKFIHDPIFLDRLATKPDRFGMDRQGLSNEAFDALLHFTHTRYFPLIPDLKVVLELALSDLFLLNDYYGFKKYLRYLLLVNINRESAPLIYEHAQRVADDTLLSVCLQGAHLLCGPTQDPHWSTREAAYQGQILMMLDQPLKPLNEDLSRVQGVLYAEFTKVEFRKGMGPLSTLFDDPLHFIVRLRTAEAYDTTPEALITEMKRLFPALGWVTNLEANLPLFLQPPSLSAVSLDLSHLEPRLVEALLTLYKGTPLSQVALSCTTAELRMLLGSHLLDSVQTLDLRPSQGKRLEFELIAIEVDSLLNLSNLYFPCDLKVLVRNIYSYYNSGEIKWWIILKVELLICGKDQPLFGRFRYLSWPIQPIVNCQFERLRSQVDEIAGPKDFSMLESVTFHKCYRSRRWFPFWSVAYCRNIIQEDLKVLGCYKLSLFGCSQVTDEWFEDPLSLVCRELDLRGTNVSEAVANKLRGTGRRVLHDPNVVERRRKIPPIPTSAEERYNLSPNAYYALMDYLYTGYYPLLSVPIAKELFLVSVPYPIEPLKQFCRKHLIANVSVDNWSDLSDFLPDDEALQYAIHFFVEVNLPDAGTAISQRRRPRRIEEADIDYYTVRKPLLGLRSEPTAAQAAQPAPLASHEDL